MLSFLRRFSKSPLGIGIFGLILIAFVVTLYEGRAGLNGLGLGLGGGGVATVGGETIATTEVERRAKIALDAERQRKPELDMAGFIADGGIERVRDQIVNGRVLEAFAHAGGMVASKKLVDGAIASIAAFNGPTGQFDRNVFLSILQQRKIGEVELRQDFAREALTKAVLVPVSGGARAPQALIAPYASLLLESRNGRVVELPTAAFRSTQPIGDADLTTFYSRHLASYTVPERRVVRYAAFDRSRFASIQPSEVEIASAYRTNAARYAGKQTRAFTQVIVTTQQQADQVAAKALGGMSLADAARPFGLEPLPVPAIDRPAFEKLTSAVVAQAAFGAPQGQIAAVARSGLGFHIVRVDAIVDTPTKTLAEARVELTPELAKAKVDAATADLVAKIEDDISGGSTFEEIVGKYRLSAATTPAVTAAGLDPDQPASKPVPALQPVLADAFRAEPDDDAAIATVRPLDAFALWDLDRIVPAAARPLAQIRAQVMADAQNDRAFRAARKAAEAVAASVNRGMPLPQAAESVGAAVRPPIPVDAKRIDVARGGDRIPAPVTALFAMTQGRAKAVEGPDRIGWVVVVLDRIVSGDIRRSPELIKATQSQLAQVIGDEYVEQFVTAIRNQVGVKRNDAALGALKRSLSGGAR